MITNLEEKLKGTLPITRNELIELINSHGRYEHFRISNYGVVERCHPKECYPLENLDISQITNLSDIFGYSFYNGDLSKWDVSSCKNMEFMFYKSKFNNDSLNFWNTSKILAITAMFYGSKFNGDVSRWDISNIQKMNSLFDNCPFDGDISKWEFNKDIYCYAMFLDNQNFINKYNSGKEIPDDTKDFLKWFEDNKKNISNLNVSKNEILDIDDYLISFNKDINLKERN